MSASVENRPELRLRRLLGRQTPPDVADRAARDLRRMQYLAAAAEGRGKSVSGLVVVREATGKRQVLAIADAVAAGWVELDMAARGDGLRLSARAKDRCSLDGDDLDVLEAAEAAFAEIPSAVAERLRAVLDKYRGVPVLPDEAFDAAKGIPELFREGMHRLVGDTWWRWLTTQLQRVEGKQTAPLTADTFGLDPSILARCRARKQRMTVDAMIAFHRGFAKLGSSRAIKFDPPIIPSPADLATAGWLHALDCEGARHGVPPSARPPGLTAYFCLRVMFESKEWFAAVAGAVEAPQWEKLAAQVTARAAERSARVAEALEGSRTPSPDPSFAGLRKLTRTWAGPWREVYAAMGGGTAEADAAAFDLLAGDPTPHSPAATIREAVRTPGSNPAVDEALVLFRKSHKSLDGASGVAAAVGAFHKALRQAIDRKATTGLPIAEEIADTPAPAIPAAKTWRDHYEKLLKHIRTELASIRAEPSADTAEVASTILSSYLNALEKGQYANQKNRLKLWPVLLAIAARKLGREPTPAAASDLAFENALGRILDATVNEVARDNKHRTILTLSLLGSKPAEIARELKELPENVAEVIKALHADLYLQLTAA